MAEVLTPTSEVGILKREFKFNDIILADPDPAMTEEAVLNFYSNAYPELTCGVISSREINYETNTLQLEVKVSFGKNG